MKKGFTLIELLVVVLIIGILAAIALPQYTKAVEKSRLAEAILQSKSMLNDIRMYYLQNGNYDDLSFDTLTNDYTIDTNQWFYRINPSGLGTHCKVLFSFRKNSGKDSPVEGCWGNTNCAAVDYRLRFDFCNGDADVVSRGCTKYSKDCPANLDLDSL
ncbi:prepilin-type N-terminal cleavage/methylation domain-containing protein [Elusimicrobium posterum]|uniref:type IV pilin protein n=1 Tax=Elusimicrobium posterum TaxID=3116653 RepID=UPI003C712634